jgi:hypothetical protein
MVTTEKIVLPCSLKKGAAKSLGTLIASNPSLYNNEFNAYLKILSIWFVNNFLFKVGSVKSGREDAKSLEMSAR